MVAICRFDVFLINLDPTQGCEIKKIRPCVVISPDEMNHMTTLIVAPMTTVIKSYPTRIPLIFNGKKGTVVLDQIRTIDKSRIIKKIGVLDTKTALRVLEILAEMFS